MEAPHTDPALTLQPFDPEVFRRVWNRVMPQQEHSPIALHDSAPAVPALSPAPGGQDGAVCLGEGSLAYAQVIQELMEETQGLLRTVQRLARRSSGRPAQVLSALAAALRREQGRLSAAGFLITGERYLPSQSGVPLPASLPLALRALFQQLQRRAARARAAAQGMEDPCLGQLLEELAVRAEGSAQRLRTLLEGMS